MAESAGPFDEDAALRLREQKFKALSDAFPLGVYHADVDGRCTYANRQCCALFGLGEAQMRGAGWLQALHPDDREPALAIWRRDAPGGHDFDLRFRIVAADGSLRVIRSRACFVAAPAPAAGDYVGALEDVTELHIAERRLRASESLLARAGRIAAVGGWELDLRTRAVSWSNETRRIHRVGAGFQPSVDDAVRFYAPEARPLIEAAIGRAIHDGSPWDLELPLTAADGSELWVRAQGEVEHEQGLPVRLTGAFQDITEARRRQAELLREQGLRQQVERHAQQLDGLLRERSEMLDVLAHEVRQPLNNASAVLQGSASALADEPVAGGPLHLARARAVISQVLASIDNTLAVASLLARPEPITREDADVDMVLAVAIADMPAGERQRIVIERLTRTRTASMDMSLMRLALRNLLANALRYAAAGSAVTIRVSDCDEPLALVLDVVNIGSVIPAERVPRLFERGARQALRSATGPGQAQAQGLGLGLYIVRRVMELHGGRVELASNLAHDITLRLVVAQAAPTGL